MISTSGILLRSSSRPASSSDPTIKIGVISAQVHPWHHTPTGEGDGEAVVRHLKEKAFSSLCDAKYYQMGQTIAGEAARKRELGTIDKDVNHWRRI